MEITLILNDNGIINPNINDNQMEIPLILHDINEEIPLISNDN